ncbi:MAG: nucleotidyltransferase domain-containing protein [Firmicutes bacterium]|nr:nucleotidyltransferase domain-containing protein [Bacillota bacterium]
MMKYINSDRHQKALEYALEYLNHSVFKQYINNVILYGSCARGEENYRSDVDLLIEFDERFLDVKKEMNREFRMLNSEIGTNELHDPEVDVKIVFGNEWKTNKICFFDNIKRDGINVWKRQ